MNGHPFWKLMQCYMLQQTENQVTVKMNRQPFQMRTLGIVHGGAIGAIIDYAATTCMQAVEKRHQLTAIRISYMKAAVDMSLLATATLLLKTERQLVIKCEVIDE